jgi:hypothetical protein
MWCEKEDVMKPTLIVSFVLAALAAPLLLAQTSRVAPSAFDAPCPRPITQTINGTATAPQPLSSDLVSLYGTSVGSQWNQTAINKHFGHTFRFVSPKNGECCLMTSGQLTVRVKALQGGGPNSSTSANDAFSLVSNGVAIQQQQPWLTTGVATGTIATLTFNVPPNVLANGVLSFFAQDDSAVLSADLSLRGCCLR